MCIFQMVVVGLHMCIMSSVLHELFKSVSLVDFFCLLVLVITEMNILKYSIEIKDLSIYPVVLSTFALHKTVSVCFTFHSTSPCP